MSWEELLSARLKITTGDGKVYIPFYTVSSNTASFEFNISEFEYPEVAGTHVDRRLHKGTRYPLEFYFQGENNVDEMKAFIISSRDRRPWTILHPIYGSIIAHPLSISFDNSGINTSKITCTCVETITDGGPRTTFDPKETAPALVTKSRDANSSFFANTVSPVVSDVSMMKSNVDSLYKEGSKHISSDEIANEYFNLYNTATTKLNTAFNEFNTSVAFIQDFIVYPAQFIQNVKARLLILKNQAIQLSLNLENLSTPNEKKIFENQKGALISAMIETVVTPSGDEYTNAVDVMDVIAILTDEYNLFIEQLQSIQTGNGGEPDAYFPDFSFMYDLNYAMNFSVGNLFSIALTAQQERIVYLESDSNLVLLTHRFYGMAVDDSTLTRFIDSNGIGINELLQINKGRKIVYYV